MQQTLHHQPWKTGITLACSIVVTSIITTVTAQVMAQQPPEKLLIAQSAVDEEAKLKFDSRGCRRTKAQQVTCDVLVTNLATQRESIRLSVGSSDAIDTSGTVYPVQRTHSGANFADIAITNGTACGCFAMNLASGIPTKVTFIFEIPQDVTELTALDIGFERPQPLWVGRRIAVSNIGRIASQTGSTPIRKKSQQN